MQMATSSEATLYFLQCVLYLKAELGKTLRTTGGSYDGVKITFVK